MIVYLLNKAFSLETSIFEFTLSPFTKTLLPAINSRASLLEEAALIKINKSSKGNEESNSITFPPPRTFSICSSVKFLTSPEKKA